MLPVANTQAVIPPLDEINATRWLQVPALSCDQTGGYTTARLEIPGNLSMVCIPPATPELNPAENIGQHLRQTVLGNRVFQNNDTIVDRPCQAWQSLLTEPGRIQSITHRDWTCVDQFL